MLKFISFMPLVVMFSFGCGGREPEGRGAVPTPEGEAHSESAPTGSSPYDAYDTYSINNTLDTARELQELGKEKAIAKLKSWARADPDDLRTIVMCRMLSKGKQAPLRRPYLGAAVFLGRTTYDDWPLEPIALFEGTPILITRGYELAGRAEPAGGYLSYCIREGIWVSERYEDRTIDQIKTSLTKFIAVTTWKDELSESDEQFLVSQAR